MRRLVCRVGSSVTPAERCVVWPENYIIFYDGVVIDEYALMINCSASSSGFA